ncbi:MAG: RICIN domain-containing protein [Clostridia bacterium]|nr:RICIN domain-containing protein [Clostridia bacterium]
MKKIIRLTSLCLAVLMVSALIPFQVIAAVSVPSTVKSVVFNATYYASKYADLKAAFGTDATKLYNHFISNGIKEGRQASPMFSVDYYLKNNADLKAAFGSNRENAFNHFVSHGINEPRVTAPAADLGTGIDVRISMNSGGMNLGYKDTNVWTVTPVFKADQSWRLDRQKDGSYKITNNATGKVLDVYAASRASGANVDLYASNDTNAQRWFIYKNTNGTYTMRAKCGTTCALSVNNNSTAAGANVQMNTYNGAAGQQFKITKLNALESMEPANIGSNFWGNIRGVGSNYNLALSGDNVLIRYPNYGYNQTWRFIRFSDGSYEITNLKTGKSLDCAAGSGLAGTNVNTYTSNNSNAQRWYIFKVDGNYVFVPKCTTECALTVAGGATASGTNLELAKYSDSSTAQQFKVIKITKSEVEKNLTISEICAAPTNGAYEFMEIINTSDKTVNLNQYSLYRFGFANSGKYESNGYNTILGLASGTGSDTSLKCLEKINLSSYNTSIAPNGMIVLWFVSYADRNLTVEDFKAYWTSQGSDMTNVTVIPVAVHDGKSNIYAATKINSGCGAGFLPDTKACVALSLIKNSALAVRLENGTNLNSLTASTDAPLAYNMTSELQSRADSIATYFVTTTAETGESRNYYNYVDYEAYVHASILAMQEPMRTYTHVFSAVPYSAQVMGSSTTAGHPTNLGKYINLNSDGETNVITFGADGGLKRTKATPGYRWCGQFAGLDLIGTSTDGEGNVTFTGKFEYDQYSKIGFVITTISTSTGEVIAKKTVNTTTFKAIDGGYSYSVKVSGLPVNDGSVVLSVVPYAIYIETGSRVNGVAEEIRCPLVSATINGKDITGLKVTYLANEVNAPANDVTGIKEAVELLANDIEYYTGVEVTTGIYDPRASYPQIVIATSGSGSGGNALVANNKTVGDNQYSIISKTAGEIYIVGGDVIAAEYASQLIIKALINATGTVELTSLCADAPKTLNTKNDHLPLTDGSDYRIMTMNMLWYSSLPDETRYNKFIEFINYYSPDVIGLQECCITNMNKFIPMLKAAGYTVIQQEVFSGTYDCNTVPLAYKTSKFTCVEKGWKQLPGGSKFFGVTWAVLKDKTTSKKLAFSTSHFYNEGVLADKVIIRQDNTKMVLSITNDIINKHNCPVINMGDFNMRSFDEAYHLMVDSGILNDSRFVSFRESLMIRTGHSLGSTVPSEGSPSRTIDYFFTTSNVNVLRTRTITNMKSATSTDHSPVYADVSFK